ncbi:MAG TPA: hypothetical protein VFP96_00975 [Candidatus Acidoferrum sp.]|nr:hypothetical protein [Candidatus Acidoferrum sp.]
MNETSSSDGNNAGSNTAPATQNAGGKKHLLAGALVLLAVLIAAIAYNRWHASSTPFGMHEVRAEQVTRNGKAATAAISPDGQSIAYVLRDGMSQSVMLRRVAESGETQLIAPDESGYAGLAFSPDAKFLYYTDSSKDNHLFSSLYKIPVTGGAATKLIDDIDTAVSFSPDGSKIAFIRGVPDKRMNDLVVANADGSGAKVVARRAGLVYAGALITPAWSPDGKTIVFTNYQATSLRYLMAVGEDGSQPREIYHTHDDLGRARWLPDGTALLVAIREMTLGERGQFWKVDYPSGHAVRAWKDQRDYAISSVDLDESAGSIATVDTTLAGDLWMLPDGDESKAQQITNRGDLIIHVAAFGPDRILYETRDGKVFTANLKGGDTKRIPMNTEEVREVEACGDGKHIVFGAPSPSGNGQSIWRMNADGGQPTALTHQGNATMPVCSPDGNWVLYWNDDEGQFYRMPIEGGSSTKVAAANPSDPFGRLSPDGRYMTYTAKAEANGKQEYNVVIVPLSGGAPTASFPMVPGMGMAPPQFAKDGQGLYFNLMRQGASNIWKMETPGGELKPVTNFPPGLITSYTWSADGKTLYVARGTKSSDVVLLKPAK